jgi:hypothetical protein
MESRETLSSARLRRVDPFCMLVLSVSACWFLRHRIARRTLTLTHKTRTLLVGSRAVGASLAGHLHLHTRHVRVARWGSRAVIPACSSYSRLALLGSLIPDTRKPGTDHTLSHAVAPFSFFSVSVV